MIHTHRILTWAVSTGLHKVASRFGANKARILRNPRLGALLQAIFLRLKVGTAELHFSAVHRFPSRNKVASINIHVTY
jgi:hypothetical protein